jgi:hypothetical protein
MIGQKFVNEVSPRPSSSLYGPSGERIWACLHVLIFMVLSFAALASGAEQNSDSQGTLGRTELLLSGGEWKLGSFPRRTSIC